MDSKKILAKYIKPSSAINIVGYVLLALAAVFLICGIFAGINDKNDATEPVLFDALESKSGSYVYLDVVGISNWLYDYDGAVYYSVEDAEGYLYTVRVSGDEYKKMTAQQDYWMRETEDEPQPTPYRLDGLAMTTTSTVKDSLADSWEISTSEYEEYFGTMYLNATTDPGSEAITGWMVSCFMCLIFGVIFCIAGIMNNSSFKRTIQALEQANLLDRAAAELNSPDVMIVGKDRARLSAGFLFGRGTCVAIPYSDIQWVYQRNVRRYFVTVNCSLIVNTIQRANIAAVNFGSADKNNVLGAAVDFMAQRNPNILLGYTGANQRAYKERKKSAQIG